MRACGSLLTSFGVGCQPVAQFLLPTFLTSNCFSYCFIRIVIVLLLLLLPLLPFLLLLLLFLPVPCLACVQMQMMLSVPAPNCLLSLSTTLLPLSLFFLPALLDIPRPSSFYGAQNFSLPLRNWSSEKVKIDFATCVVAATPPASPRLNPAPPLEACQLFIRRHK